MAFGIAETARLLAQYDFKDNSAAGVASASRGIGTLQGKVGGLHGALTRAGGAIGNFGGRIKQLAGFGAGLLGVGGLFSLGKLLSDSITKARAFGDASIRLSQLTQLPIEAMSRMIDALDFFGISAEKQTAIAGKFEKAIGTLAEQSATGVKKVQEWNKTHDKAITPAQRLALLYPKLSKFQKDYGLRVTDTKGKLLDYNAQLLASADFFNNKSIPAQKKAAALQKLYGKGWQDLIPILAQGRAGILKAEQEAMHLSQADLDAITKNKLATRQWQDALGDLETQIGIKLLPTLTDLLTGATGFIQSHSEDIKNFVMNAVGFAKGVVGTIAGVAEELGGLWDKIPQPLKDFISGPLLKLAIGEKAIKFLFGISPVEIALKASEGLLTGITKAVGNDAASKLLPQHVWVDNLIAGGLSPAGTPVTALETAAAGGLAYKFGQLLGNAIKIATVIGLADLASQIGPTINQAGIDLHKLLGLPDIKINDLQWPFGPKNTPTILPDIFGGNGLLGGTAAPPPVNPNLNKPGSPDDRDERHRDALKIAATLDKTQTKLSKKIEDSGAIAKTTKQSTDAVRDKLEAARIALASKAQATTLKVGDLDRTASSGLSDVRQTTASGTSQIVSAIQSSQPIVNVDVKVSGMDVTVTKTYSNGDMGGRTGGGARKR